MESAHAKAPSLSDKLKLRANTLNMTPIQVGNNKARAAGRALEVLEFFREYGVPARTVEIGRALGIPNSSADDLLKALNAAGYLSFNAHTKCYSPSYQVIRLAEEFMGKFSNLSQVHEIERTMRDDTGQTVLVAIQEGAMLRVVSALNGVCDEPLMRIGCRRPLAHYDETSGWNPTSNFAGALLAANTDLEIVEILSELEEPGRLTDFKRLLERVKVIRNRGLADQEVARSPSIAVCASWISRSKAAPAMAIGCIGYSREYASWRRYFDGGASNVRNKWAVAK
jgi:DNA-binding IclR family transcriptional regulator